MYHALGLLASNRYELDLSNEVPNIAFGQEAAKVSEIKAIGRKKYLLVQSGLDESV